MALKLEILTRSTLLDVEELARQLNATQEDTVDIWLPTDIGAQFFKESRIAALLATGAARRELIVTDWIGQSDIDRNRKRFGARIEGIAGVVYAKEIINAKKERLSFGSVDLKEAVIDRAGILEPKIAELEIGEQKGGSPSLTFCAFDDEAPVPIAFAGLTKDAFISEFRDYRRRVFEIGVGENYSERVKFEDDRALAGFVYELYQNSFEHGRLDEHGNVIAGVRYIRLRKHIDHDKDAFIKRADGFPELEAYLNAVVPPKKSFMFYEISVSDQGLGIADRFLATRPEFASEVDTLEKRIVLINRIIDEALSSKRSPSGAGYGLRRAMAAAKSLRGFISLRTDRLWLYQAFAAGHTSSQGFTLPPVNSSHDLPPIVGTHFNMLFPLS